MNIIKQYELKYITLENLSDEIWGYGQQLINEIGIDCFKFYVLIAGGYLNFEYHILNYSDSRFSV
ncbi:TPA: hypothetical protein NBM10_001423 [Enterococcus faecium]|nr:hypothetical protein [Enterococcus faecium]